MQNNVLELWSLFDFLMPGFLGTERQVCINFAIISDIIYGFCFLVTKIFEVILQFQATYGKPLVAARDSKCSAKDAEAGVLAMEALHKQV